MIAVINKWGSQPFFYGQEKAREFPEVKHFEAVWSRILTVVTSDK